MPSDADLRAAKLSKEMQSHISQKKALLIVCIPILNFVENSLSNEIKGGKIEAKEGNTKEGDRA